MALPSPLVRFGPIVRSKNLRLWLSAELQDRADVPLKLSVAKKAKAAALPPHSKYSSKYPDGLTSRHGPSTIN